jgi:hypothetical protein
VGVDVDVEGVVDTFASGVWEPTVNKVRMCVCVWGGGGWKVHTLVYVRVCGCVVCVCVWRLGCVWVD